MDRVFPLEFLVNTIGYLDVKSQLNCRLVSSEWKSIVDSHIGISLSLGTGPSEFGLEKSLVKSPKLKPETLKMMRKIGINSCTIGNLPADFDDLEDGEIYNSNDYPLQILLGYPECLKSLHLAGTLSQRIYKSLTNVQNLEFLKKFSISSNTLMSIRLPRLLRGAKFSKNCGISDSYYPKTGLFPHLVTFQICSKSLDQHESYCNLGKILQNSSKILDSIDTGKLENLLIDLPHLPDFEDSVTFSILQCISRHFETLRKLDMHWTSTIFGHGHKEYLDENLEFGQYFNHILSPQVINQMIQEDQENFIEEENLVTRMIDWSKFKAKNLTTICFTAVRFMKTFKDWKNLIDIQENLTQLYLMNDQRLSKLSFSSLIKPNLTKILLHLNPWDGSGENFNLDCNLFSKCTNLTHLLLRGRSLNQTIRPEHNSKLLNIHGLPPALVYLSVREIHIKTKDLDTLLLLNKDQNDQKMCPKLEKIRLIEVGGCTKKNYGISPDTFFQLIEEKKLKEIELFRGMNRSMLKNFQVSNVNDGGLKWLLLYTSVFHSQLWTSQNGEKFYSFKNANMFWNPGTPNLRPYQIINMAFL